MASKCKAEKKRRMHNKEMNWFIFGEQAIWFKEIGEVDKAQGVLLGIYYT